MCSPMSLILIIKFQMITKYNKCDSHNIIFNDSPIFGILSWLQFSTLLDNTPVLFPSPFELVLHGKLQGERVWTFHGFEYI